MRPFTLALRLLLHDFEYGNSIQAEWQLIKKSPRRIAEGFFIIRYGDPDQI
jgi:hypothetical protein